MTENDWRAQQERMTNLLTKLNATITRLETERDEARRVARTVAREWMSYLLTGVLPESPAVDTALAYPEKP